MNKGTVGRTLGQGGKRSVKRIRHLPMAAAGLAALGLGAAVITGIAPGFGPHPDGAATAALSPMIVTSVDGPGPSVWLTALAVPERVPFALEGQEATPVLPRVVRPLPPLPERETEPVETVTQAPVQAPVQAQAQPAEHATAPETPTDATGPVGLIAAAARDETAVPHPRVAEDPARPGFAAALARLLRQHGNAVVRDGLLFARLAPRRSPQPGARPEGLVPAPLAEPADAAPAAAVALARSVLPQPRPESVARLASLDLSSPTLARAEPPVATAPALSPTLDVPALGRALARADQCESRLTRAIPRRGRAEDGSTVIARLASAHGRTRDDALIGEVLQGNMPDFLRDLVPVSFTGTGPNGQPMRVTICVMPDYLAVGSDRDFVRVPLGLPAAMRIAERFDMVLPTTAMVDAIFAQASVRLAPSPMTPGPQMESTGYFQRHNATVQQQLASAGGRLGQLVAGHKKDLVLTNRIERNPGRVAIYGWHRPSGRPIQSLSTVHGAQYADYSHGIRLVSRTAYVNGRATDLRDLLSDGRYAGLISSEGPITNRTLLAALR